MTNLSGLLNGAKYLVRVSEKNHFPAAVGGVITLSNDTVYYVDGSVDLTGDRLVAGSNTCLTGGSSENAKITSTGLAVGVALLTCNAATSLPISNLSFFSVDTALAINGSSTLALDWSGLNFVDIPNIGTIQNVDNFIYTKGAFLSSQGLVFSGNASTIAFSQSIFEGSGAAGTIIQLSATAVVNRRFRIIYSSFVVSGLTVGVDVNNAATIPSEGYILDTVNFSGGSTYTQGVASTDNKALWVGCRGINNSAEVSNYYMLNNLTATVIGVVGVPVKAAGSTLSDALTQKFANTDNRATYTGSLTRLFQITATLSLSSGNNQVLGIYVAKNGSIIPASEVYVTTTGSGDAQAVTVQAITQLNTNDYIEIFVENETATQNIVVGFLNVICKSIGD